MKGESEMRREEEDAKKVTCRMEGNDESSEKKQIGKKRGCPR